MIPLRTLIIGLLCWLGSSECRAWSAAGHGDVTVAAFEQLPATVLAEYRPLLTAGPWAKGDISWAAAAARAAAWPDRIRDMPLRKLFGRYGSGKVPAALAAFRQQNTGDWHYTNALYWSPQGTLLTASTDAGATCPPPADGRLLTVWPDLLRAYREVSDVKDKALVLAFILHLLADAYQPLHLLASLDQSCKHDRGGNAYCLVPPTGFRKGQRCDDSLHYLWDQGFGVFAGDLADIPRFRGDPADLGLAVQKVRTLAPQIYPSQPGQALQPAYTKQGRIQVRELSTHAAAHLAAILRQLARP